jgi:prepilin peptidase CpaA
VNILASKGAWLAAGGWHTVSFAVLVALLFGAALVDIREHRIPNALVFPGAVVALLMAHLPGGSVSGSFIGIAVGIGMTLPLYLLRAMGAGDVKLMGMVGAFLGGGDMFAASMVIFVVGGVLGLVAVMRQRAFRQLALNMKQMVFDGLVNTMAGSGSAIAAPTRSVGVQPYGVAIAGGTMLYLAVVKGGLLG